MIFAYLALAAAVAVMLYFWRQGRGAAITSQVQRQMNAALVEQHVGTLRALYAPLYREGFRGTHTDAPAGDLDSRLGGPILWPKGQTPPMDESGQMMVLLVQINLADMDGALGLPKAGHVQVFVHVGEFFGLNLQDMTFGGFHAAYHPAGTEFDRHPFAMPPDAVTPFMIPGIEAEGRAIKWDRARIPPTFWDYRIEGKIRALTLDDASADEALDKVWQALADQRGLYDVLLLGTPDFTQDDIRGDESLAGYENLVGFSSGGGAFMWGDAGEAVVLVPNEDLKRFDLSRAIYSWDCC